MTGKGQITTQPDRRFRWMLAAQLSWLAVVLALGVWWQKLMLSQASRIEELERLAGAIDSAHALGRTQRMLYWESMAYLVLLVAITVMLVWVHWRQSRRARGIQAFFAGVTHELRTPLTSIRLQAESIADSLPEQSADRDLVRRLLEDTLRLEGQVERTLELARVEGGGRVHLQSVALRSWLARLSQPWVETYGGRLALELNGVSPDHVVHADPGGLQVIFRNLVENSLRHGRRETIRVTLASAAEKGGITVRFADDGAGLDQAFSGRLGQIFEKGGSSTGAGVGLYLVRVLVERMGGRARFDGARQAGFEVDLHFRAASDGGADG